MSLLTAVLTQDGIMRVHTKYMIIDVCCEGIMGKQDLYKNTGIKQNVIEEIIQLAQRYSVGEVILFGSRARGDYKERSDIDLAFRGGNSSRFILSIDEDTSTLLEFDVIDLDKPVRQELLEAIEREGLVIYEKI